MSYNSPVLDLLKSHFGYDRFRPLQEDIISSVLARRDTGDDALGHLMPPPERLARIKAAFHEADSVNLLPVRELLGEGFSYEEIRQARIAMRQNRDILQ